MDKITYTKHDKDSTWSARFIRDKMELAGLTQKQVVNYINKNPEHKVNLGEFSQIITGKKKPRYSQLELILTTLKFSEEDIAQIRKENPVVDALYEFHDMGI